MSKNKSKESVRHIALDPDPKGERKDASGSNYDDWNDWLTLGVSLALPINQKDEATASRATTAALSGIIDMKPTDPIEGILILQLMAANQASLSMYQRAWAQPGEYLEARLRYLALADKAARTVVLLTERLDHHRGREQQKIVVQHVTTNNVTADQAVITDSLVTNKPASNADFEVVTASDAKPMPTFDVTRQRDLAGWGRHESEMNDNPMQRAHAAPRCKARSKRTGKPCRAPAVRGFRVCRMHGARGGAPEGKRNGNYRHGARSKEMIELWKLIKSLR